LGGKVKGASTMELVWWLRFFVDSLSASSKINCGFAGPPLLGLTTCTGA
jgi:hypothetical protein